VKDVCYEFKRKDLWTLPNTSSLLGFVSEFGGEGNEGFWRDKNIGEN